eukprot:14395.XXX_283393_283799_1 [CDS] Oithona nana genome sequencing.
MTLQRGSRKRKSKSTSEENDLGCAKILTEFQILQSLIPQIAGRMDITELEIIDACVDYIESLQNQLSQSGTSACKWPRLQQQSIQRSLLTPSTTKLSALVKCETGTLRRHNVRMR